MPNSVFDPACAGCAAPLQRKRLPWTRHPGARAAKIALLLSVVGAAAAVPLFRKANLEPWALRERAQQAYQEGRFADAVKDLEAVTAALPRDADAWYNLALLYTELKFAPEVAVAAARNAANADRNHFKARHFLAATAAARGDWAAAEADCEEAIACRGATADAFRLRAKLELRKPSPDYSKTVRTILDGIAAEPTSAEMRVLLAEVYLQQHGTYDASAYPPEVLAAVIDARRSLDTITRGAPGDDVITTLRARLLLASGEAAEAFALAKDTLTRLPEDAPRERRVALHLVAGQGAWAWKRLVDETRTHFVAALAADPSMETAATIARFLGRSEGGDVARAILRSVDDAADRAGAVAAVLASFHSERGEFDEASAAIARARAKLPQDIAYAALDGDIRAARGDIEGARAAYTEAEREPATAKQVRLRRILLVLRETLPAAERTAALRRALTEVNDLAGTGDAPLPLAFAIAAARLRIALGENVPAQRVLIRSLDANPGTAEAWALLGTAHAAEGGAVAMDRAATAFGRARSLQPRDITIRRAEAQSLLQAGDAPGALVAAGGALQLFPDDEPLLGVRAEAYLRLEQWRDAAVDLRKLRERHPNDMGLLVRLANAETRAGDRQSAAALLDRAYAEADGPTRDTIDRLRVRFGLTDVDAAIRELRTRGASALLAEMLYRRADVAGAAATARDVLVQRPGDPVATGILVVAVLNSDGGSGTTIREARAALAAIDASAAPQQRAFLDGRILIAERKFEEAWTALSPIRAALPPDPVFEFMLGEAAMQTDRLDEAIAAFERAMTVGPMPGVVQLQLADRFAALAARVPARADDLARSSLRLDPGCMPAVKLLGESRAAARDFAGAAAIYERALRGIRNTDESRIELRVAAAWSHICSGNAALALLHVEEARKIAPDDARTDILAGFAHLAAYREPEARAAFESILAARPGERRASIGLVRCAVLRGDPDAAVALSEAWAAAHPEDITYAVVTTDALRAAGFLRHAAVVATTRHAALPGDERLAQLAVQSNLAAKRNAEAAAAATKFEGACAPDQRSGALLLAAEVAAATPASAAEALQISEKLTSGAAEGGDVALIARTTRIRAFLMLRRNAEALAEAKAVLADPRTGSRRDVSLRALVDGGAAACELRDLKAAEDLLGRAALLDPSNATAFNNLAWVLQQDPASAGRALAAAVRATTLDPAVANFWDTRGTCAATAKNGPDAVASWREALRLHEAAPAASPRARARTAIRLAKFLRESGDEAGARAVAADVARFAPPPPAEELAEAAAIASER